MWGQFMEDEEKDKELQMMDLDTLKLIYNKLQSRLKLIKDRKPKSKSIEGMELACQIIFGLIADKSYMEEE